MMTERERAVRRVLLEELGGKDLKGLAYVERRHLEDRIDAAFIDRDLAKMRKRDRWMLLLAGVGGGLFLTWFVWVTIIGVVHRIPLSFPLMSLNATLIGMIQHLQYQKRMGIYRALRALEASPAQAPGPEAVPAPLVAVP